jgi:hypothetical protein
VHIQGFYALVSDITTLKETEQRLRAAKEEAKQANRAKSCFLGWRGLLPAARESCCGGKHTR